MGLFDNIFLDKDTPTALLDNPEIKAPAGSTTENKEEVPYDPKNDPIAPAIDTKTEEVTENSDTNSSDVSFDIGGDLDFSNIGSPTQAITEEKISGTESTTPIEGTITTQEVGGSDENVSSIAMIQGGTASLIDSIDIGGTEGVVEAGVSPEIHIEIHDIEDHQAEATQNTSSEESGIYGFMGDSKEEEEMVEIEEEKTENITTSPVDIASQGEVIVDSPSSPIIDISGELPTRTERGGRIQELIEKLINELKILDEEEQRIENERKIKLAQIEEREKDLEHEYSTRKEALRYEKNALEQSFDKSTEKERIKSLIASFEEDLG